MRIFIAEDDPWYAKILQPHLDWNPDYEIHTFRNASSQLRNMWERREHIPLIFDQVLKEFAEENGTRPATLTDKASKALDRLLAYNWPGNTRELKAVAQLAMVLSDGFEINPKDIRFHHGTENGAGLVDREMTLKEYNIAIINHCLACYEGKVLPVADKLSIGNSTIYRMLKYYPEIKSKL